MLPPKPSSFFRGEGDTSYPGRFLRRCAPEIRVAHKKVRHQKDLKSQSSPGENKKGIAREVSQPTRDRAYMYMCMILVNHDEKFPCACMHKYARATTQHTTRTWNSLKIRRTCRRRLPRASGLGQDLPAVSAPPSVRGKSDLSVTLLSCLRKSMRTSLGQSQG